MSEVEPVAETRGVRVWPLLILLAAMGTLATYGAHARGDGGEYLLQAHALATHGTPDVRLNDVDWLARREPSLRRVARDIARGMREQSLNGGSSLRRDSHGEYYTLHFWFYSLLAVPCLALTELIGGRPSCALALVNASAAAGAVFALWLHFGRNCFALAASALFVLCGTTFYLAWPGPEALTAAAVVVACVLGKRGKLGGGLLMGAVAATQNASAAALLPFVAWNRWRLGGPLKRKELVLAGAAGALTLLPYGFCYAHFGVASLTGHFATDPRLISFDRAWSLFFDLNQGLILGMPAVLLGSTIGGLAAATRRRGRRALATDVAATSLLVLAMTVPTLSVHNWNAGNSVIVRYGYWIAMPLLVLTLDVVAALGQGASKAIALGLAVVQLAAIAPNGLRGERSNYLRHSWAAAAVLRRFPGLYNPVPEIFFERSLGREAPFSTPRVVLWPAHGAPRKILAPSERPPRSRHVCPLGTTIKTEHAHPTSGGWIYLDPPFQCEGSLESEAATTL